MKEYQNYQDQLAEVEAEEGHGDAVEQHVPTLFLFLGAATPPAQPITRTNWG